MTSKGAYDFIDYLERINEMKNLFVAMTTSIEILSELPLTDEQVELTNAYFEKMQKEWSETFVQLLEVGVKWLKNNEENEE